MGDSALNRFRAALADLAPDWAASDTPLLIALSGGADSCALLWLAANSFSGRVHALTVDHQLRAEAADEALFCASLCARLGVSHNIAVPEHPIGGNIQSEARAARYALLTREAERLGGARIATAHHAGDQLETVLMRLARGSGVAGLSGIRAANGAVLRPLLAFSKDELITICRDAEIDWIEDPSNANTDYDRVRMRGALARTDLRIEPIALVRSTKALCEAEKALDFTARHFAADRIAEHDGHWRLDARTLPRELVRRLVLMVIEAMGEERPRGHALDRLNAALESGEKASIGALVATGGEIWRFERAPPRRR